MTKPDATAPKPARTDPKPQGGFIRPAREGGTETVPETEEPASTT